jgi:hypothetical protein
LRALANLLRDGSKRETRPRRLPMRSGNSSAGLGKPDEVARPSEESSTRAMALDKACGSTLLGKWCMNLRSVPRLTQDDHLLTRSSVPWHSVLLARIDIMLGLDRDWSLAGHQLARSSLPEATIRSPTLSSQEVPTHSSALSTRTPGP